MFVAIASPNNDASPYPKSLYTYMHTYVIDLIPLCLSIFIYLSIYLYKTHVFVAIASPNNAASSGPKSLYTFTDGYYTKSTRAHTHRELIRPWLWEPKAHTHMHVYIYLYMYTYTKRTCSSPSPLLTMLLLPVQSRCRRR